MIRKIPLYLSILLLFQSITCIDDTIEDYSQYEPVVLSRTQLENSIQLTNPRTVVNSGKIYLKDTYIFVGEEREGFHVYDNSDPSNPQKVKFLTAPGVTDIAIRDNILFLNQATDLVALEFNLTSGVVNVTKRVANIFPELYSPDGYYPYDLAENEVIVNWKLKTNP